MQENPFPWALLETEVISMADEWERSALEDSVLVGTSNSPADGPEI